MSKFEIDEYLDSIIRATLRKGSSFTLYSATTGYVVRLGRFSVPPAEKKIERA